MTQPNVLNTSNPRSKTTRIIKAILKLAAETVLIATVGSFFWIALGKEVVQTYATGSWELASGAATFWNFFTGIVQLYLLYRFVQWVIGYLAKKTAKTVDDTFQDVGTYSDVRDRVVNAFTDGDPMPRFDPTQNQTEDKPKEQIQEPTQIDPRGCQWCGVLPGSFHLTTCQRNAP